MGVSSDRNDGIKESVIVFSSLEITKPPRRISIGNRRDRHNARLFGHPYELPQAPFSGVDQRQLDGEVELSTLQRSDERFRLQGRNEHNCGVYGCK
jgi:hypothetical protein